MAAMTYEVEVMREGKNWLATVRGLPGGHTYAGNLTVLRENVYEVIELVTGSEGDRPPLRYVFTEPADQLVADAAAIGVEREAAENALLAAQSAAASMAQQLAAANYSVRDIAGALRLTPGRVSQILGADRSDLTSTLREPTSARSSKSARDGATTAKSQAAKSLSRSSSTGRYLKPAPTKRTKSKG